MPNPQLLAAERNEITEYQIYSRLAAQTKDANNRRILEQIAADELRHSQVWEKYSGQPVKPNRKLIWFYFWLAKIFGLSFGLKLMEKGESLAQANYQTMTEQFPEAAEIYRDEESHEARLIDMLNEEKLQYIGSIVLGLNDALVELTGALAGLTFALQNTRLIALAGLITGIAASLSMAVSVYLSNQTSTAEKHPLRAGAYTGIAYILTVILLVLPYLLISNVFAALAATLIIAMLIIAGFNFYVSVAQGTNFRRRFLEMAALSLGVSALTFLIGAVVRIFWQVQI
ncbi:MAG: VIT1/CCC1 transporter family protein [Patescibacteria group bacterium]|jgi:VIT1/CCC1 family predicted Fe2+/Mn2+ transporter